MPSSTPPRQKPHFFLENKLAKLLIEDALAVYTLQEYTYKNGFKATYVDKDVFASGLIHVTQLLPPDEDNCLQITIHATSHTRAYPVGSQKFLVYRVIVMQGVM